jgi:hypothetical protein
VLEGNSGAKNFCQGVAVTQLAKRRHAPNTLVHTGAREGQLCQVPSSRGGARDFTPTGDGARTCQSKMKTPGGCSLRAIPGGLGRLALPVRDREGSTLREISTKLGWGNGGKDVEGSQLPQPAFATLASAFAAPQFAVPPPRAAFLCVIATRNDRGMIGGSGSQYQSPVPVTPTGLREGIKCIPGSVQTLACGAYKADLPCEHPLPNTHSRRLSSVTHSTSRHRNHGSEHDWRPHQAVLRYRPRGPPERYRLLR